ncbi:hypothetical protein ACHAXA_010999 [Cyclostephanos tholiformis]|uniref:Uncharacterized protein n=1 Tax=Cyclostephanos tholiformis TaxID=382380 RepID=A0ABD3RDD8_9STRA
MAQPMDAAPLMIPGEIGYDIVGLASEKGICGSEEDLTRAEQLVIDGEMHFNAPSIIHAVAQAATVDDFASCDNRDMTLYFFESLHPTPREMAIGSLRSGHIHGLMVRAVMSVGLASSPKKGKVPKPTEERSYRCLCLRRAVSRAREFRQEAALDEVGCICYDGLFVIKPAIIS